MKKIIYLLIFCCLSIISEAQNGCVVEGTNNSGVRFESINFNEEQEITLEGEGYSQTFADTVAFPSNEVTFFMQSSIDSLPPTTDSIYWRISLDINLDGVYDTDEILHESGAVSLGAYSTMLTLPEFGFESVRYFRVEMVDDTTFFGICDDGELSENDVYMSLDYTGILTDKKLAVKNTNSSGNTTQGACPYCLPFNDTLVFEFERIDGDFCAIQVEEIHIYDGSGSSIALQKNTDYNIFEVSIYDDTRLFITSQTNQPFDLADIDDEDIAVVKIAYNLGSSTIKHTGNKGRVIVYFSEGTCLKGNPTQPKTPLPYVSGALDMCIGCFPDTCVVYDNHASTILGTENQLPYYTGAYKSITAKDNVIVRSGDEAIFKVNQDGFIKITKEVKVEAGGYFWAYKGEECLQPITKVSEPPPVAFLIEGRTEAYELNSNLNIYPNPFDDNLYVEYSGMDNEIIEMEIIDLLGKSVWKNQISTIKQYNIDTSQFENGIYFLRVKMNKEWITKTIIKAK